MKTSDVVISVVAIGGIGALAYFTLSSMNLDFSSLDALGNSVKDLLTPDEIDELEDQTYEDRYSKEARKYLNELIDEGIDEGVVSKGKDGIVIENDEEASAETRLSLAKIECQRAVDDYNIPQSKFDACVKTVKKPNGEWEYIPDGARYAVIVFL